ncbi:G patch domain-containing protein 11-like [Teleopsis dalmanni]|uniref:G patch domain-containing protein 11-like n=1 Tax=Teleopsis dalmanni TaxID=139649 RepID=UPI000D32A5AD|nr:G patch domain-containing protein 11-like [Teleopsis dalmanni]
MSDDEDYMSDKFLKSLEAPATTLIQNRAKKREIDIAKRKADSINKQREESKRFKSTYTNESLQESLKRPLQSDNKGYQLLAKMGYKPGQSLGKINVDNENESKKLTEPIGISIKEDRSGLGRAAALKELKEKRCELIMQRLREEAGATTTAADYRKRVTEKAEERYLQTALKRCQTTCANLDMQSRISQPDIAWFWPECDTEKTDSPEDDVEETQSSASDDEDITQYTVAEKVDLLTSYLRTSYLFCYWCGVRYNDKNDLESNCPGLGRDEH